MNLNNIQNRVVFGLLSVTALFGILFCAGRMTAQLPPAATVTAVNPQTGVVTAKVNSIGQVFTFTLANKAQLGQVRPGQGVFVNLSRKQVSLDGRTASGTILSLLPLGRPAGSQSGSSASSASGACQAVVGDLTVCSPASGSTLASPVQITAAAMSGVGYVNGQPTSYPITAMRVFVDNGPTSAYSITTGSLNTALPMSTGSHSILVRGWDSSGGVYEKSLTVTVNAGSSGGATSSGNTNPAPVSYPCPTGSDSNSDGCGKSGSAATNVGSVTCGTSITITGITPSAPLSDWLVFQVTTPRANCAKLVIDASVSTSPVSRASFDVVTSVSGQNPVSNSYSTTGLGYAIGVPGIAGLGTITSPLQPGQYYIRIYGTQSAAASSTWTLKITG